MSHSQLGIPLWTWRLYRDWGGGDQGDLRWGWGSKGYHLSSEEPIGSSLQMTAVPMATGLGLVEEANQQ